MYRHFKIWILQSILLATVLVAHSQNRPKLQCLEVEDNGNVRVTWTPPADTTGITGYEFYRTTGRGVPFLQVHAITSSGVRTYIDPTVNVAAAMAMDSTIFYYVCVKKSSVRLLTDTLGVMHIYANYIAGNGTANISWTSPRSPLLTTDDPTYSVWVKRPIDLSWKLLGTTPNLTWIDTVMNVCGAGDTSRYKANIVDHFGRTFTPPSGEYCLNGSPAVKVFVIDKTAPAIPVLDSVSVNSSGSIGLGWVPPPQVDVAGYIIYMPTQPPQPPGWIPVDTVYGKTNSYWLDGVNPSSNIQQYRIAAFDSCWQTSPMIAKAQNNIVLDSSKVDPCGKKFNLTWNDYLNMTGNLGHYQIWLSDNGGPYLNVDVTTNNTYTCTGLITNHSYSVFVKAVNLNGSIKASSNRLTIDLLATEQKDLCYITAVSVNDDQYVEIEILTSGDTLPFSQLEIYRSENDNAHFSLLTTLSYATAQNLYLYVDQRVKTDRTLYYYKAIVHGNCSPEPKTSNIARTILLKGEGNDSHENTLIWNNYADWDGGVDSYTIYRKNETEKQFASIQSAYAPNLTANQYMDDVSTMFATGSTFKYYVAAFEAPNIYGFTATSRSNIVELQQLPATYIPNAFTPRRTTNQTFGPFNSFVPMDDYHFYIYDRYGSLLYFSSNPNDGWDGTSQGKQVPQGVYVWKLRYKYNNDKLYEKMGFVTIID